LTYEKISPPSVPDFPNEWYDCNLTSHFWFAWRMRALQKILSRAGLPLGRPLRGLDIGCGIGLLRAELERLTGWTVDGTDINEPALQKSVPSRGRTLLYDIQEKLPVFKEAYDVVILFDVLEHIRAAGEFLNTASWYLKPGGTVLINVPALQPLYSQYDRLVGHILRYDRRSLKELVSASDAGLQVTDACYWGFSLVPVVWLRKWMIRNVVKPEAAISAGFQPSARWINAAFLSLMRIETTFLSNPPLGSSLMLAARKKSG
jgi:SAM-dependent methyltransferase